MSQKLRLMSLSLAILTASHLGAAFIFAKSAQRGTARASSFRVVDTATSTGGKLYITVAGRERKIYDEAFEAWLINDGRDVVFSSHDGAGGFENEGQSLRIYNVANRSIR